MRRSERNSLRANKPPCARICPPRIPRWKARRSIGGLNQPESVAPRKRTRKRPPIELRWAGGIYYVRSGYIDRFVPSPELEAAPRTLYRTPARMKEMYGSIIPCC